ncbi:MAG: cytochrome P450 [Thermomicrobiales bacterium]
MTVTSNTAPPARKRDRSLGLYRLLDPAVLADPYPLYDRLRTEEPVYWDAVLHAWIVTRYQDVVTVLQRFSAERTPDPDHLAAKGLETFNPIAEVLRRQMIFMDPPAHTRIRRLASTAFTPHRVETLRQHIQEITDSHIAAVRQSGRMDVVNDLAVPLPATVISELIGVPDSDRPQVRAWTSDFAEVLGNFQYSPDRVPQALHALEELTSYLRGGLRGCPHQLQDGLVTGLLAAEERGDRLSEDEVIANSLLNMTGGQETTSILISNSVLTLLRNPDQLRMLREDPSLIPTAIEEVLRFESPIQYTARLVPEDMEFGGQMLRKRQAVMGVIGAANRDPERFSDPDTMDIHRENNRHLSFGWAVHFCFGAPLARMEAQIALETLLRLPNLQLEPGPLMWHDNQGFRGLKSLPITFGESRPGVDESAGGAS